MNTISSQNVFPGDRLASPHLFLADVGDNPGAILLWWIVFALIGAGIGAVKGRVGPCLLLGLLLGPLGLLVALGLQSKKQLLRKTTKLCPYCSERVARSAKICKHCRNIVELVPCPFCKVELYRPNTEEVVASECPNCSRTVYLR